MLHMKELSKTYRRSDTMVSRKIGDEVILVPIRNKTGDLDSIFTLNELAAFIWDGLDGINTLEQVRNAIVREYDVPEETAAADLIGCIHELESIDAVAVL